MDSERETYFCIMCGAKFAALSANTALCPGCGGPPEAKAAPAPEAGVGTRLWKEPGEESSGAIGTRRLEDDAIREGGINTRRLDQESPGGEVTAPVPASSAEAWQTGDLILDLYEVKGELGEGGTGTVYRVHHQGWNLDLAVKTPSIEALRRAGTVADFMAEAETWMELGLHPHVVSCHYVRTIDEIPRVFAELVEGGSLKDWIEQGRLYQGSPSKILARLLDVAIQFAWGLAYAHEEGLVHKDVKPANVLLTEEGLVKMTDFGLARARQQMLTAEYCSPEQAAGRTDLTQQTDIWSWAVSALELFVGRRTWSFGEIADQYLQRYLESDTQRPDLPPMPPALGELLGDCLREDPDERPQEMAAVAERVQEIYEEVVWRTYPRERPEPAELRADSLNNRALSLLDLGREEEAEAAWEKALQIDPHHLKSTYNLGLWQWRKAIISDVALVERLREVRASSSDPDTAARLLTQIHLERSDYSTAAEVLDEAIAIPAVHRRRHPPWHTPTLAETFDELLAWPAAQPFAATLRAAHDHLPATRWLIQTEETWQEAVHAIAVNADGSLIVTGGQDNTVRCWELSGNTYRQRSYYHHANRLGDDDSDNHVVALQVSADGRYALSAGWDDRTAWLWDWGEHECLQILREKSYIHAVDLRTDLAHALIGTSDKVALWELAMGKRLRTFEGHEGVVNAVCFTNAGQHAVSGSKDRTLKLWELASGRCLHTFEGSTASVQTLSISSDDGYILSGGADTTLKLWRIDNGECLRTFSGHTARVNAVYFAANDRHAVSCGEDNTIRLWDIDTGRCIRTLEGHTKAVKAIAVSRDGELLASGGWDDTLRVWRIGDEPYKPIAAPYALTRIVQSEHALSTQRKFQRDLEQARVALDQQQVGEAIRSIRSARAQPSYRKDPEAVRLWQRLYTILPRVGLAAAWETQVLLGHTDRVWAVEVSADGRYAVSGSWKTIKVWDLATGQCSQTLAAHEGSVHALKLSTDNRLLLSGSSDDTLRLWEFDSGRCIWRTSARQGQVYAVDLGPKSRFAFSGGRGPVKLWDAQRGRWLSNPAGSNVSSLCVSTDGSCILCGGFDGAIGVWYLTDSEQNQEFDSKFRGHEGAVRSVAMTSDRQYALSAGQDGLLKKWSMANGFCQRTLRGHTDSVLAVALSADDRFAVSGGRDCTIRIWDVHTGECLRILEGHSDDVLAVAFSPDARFIVSGSKDKSVRLWTLDWKLTERQPVNWAKGARHHLETFLTVHTPYAEPIPDCFEPAEAELQPALTREGTPTWTEGDFQQLLVELGHRGYGSLRPEGVRRRLEKMAGERQRQ